MIESTNIPSQPKFEDELDRLETIVSRLEEGGLHLEENLKLFEQGQQALQMCRRTLEAAQVKVEKLLADGERQLIDPATLGR